MCSAGPGARSSAGCCLYNDSLIVFGGKGIKSSLNDLFTLDLNTWQWR
ncbi:kelch repeat-containing protein [Staphylococcus aureus]